MEQDTTYKNISEEILVEFENNPRARSMANSYRRATSDKLRAFYGYNLFEQYATNEIWLAWYRSGSATKAYMSKIGKIGGKIGGAKSKGGGRPRKYANA